eukprot:1151964-Pelagomonas_calceolata.AAC.13
MFAHDKCRDHALQGAIQGAARVCSKSKFKPSVIFVKDAKIMACNELLRQNRPSQAVLLRDA